MKISEVEEEMQEMQDSLNEYSKQRNFNYEKYKPIAIGYLDITEQYKKGPVSQNFINKLRQVWKTGLILGSLGHHTCEFCEKEPKATSSSEKTLMDRENMIEYKFPEMIFHYIEKHNYQPPEEFILFILKLDLNSLVIPSLSLNLIGDK